MEPCTVAFLGLHKNFAPVVHDDPFTQSQPDTRSFKMRLVVQPLKDQKNLLQELGTDPNAIVYKDDLPIRDLIVQ